MRILLSIEKRTPYGTSWEGGENVVLVRRPADHNRAKPVNGCLIADFLAPGHRRRSYTYPESLKDEVESSGRRATLLRRARDFRTNDKDYLIAADPEDDRDQIQGDHPPHGQETVGLLHVRGDRHRQAPPRLWRYFDPSM